MGQSQRPGPADDAVHVVGQAHNLHTEGMIPILAVTHARKDDIGRPRFIQGVAHAAGIEQRFVFRRKKRCDKSVVDVAIAHHIETEHARINAKIAKTKKIIELQKEYRTALISEVVTGKIKVTQEAQA